MREERAAVTRVLAMSSWVSAGHVGLSAMAPVLQALGHAVIQLPTAVLSNHNGWPAVAGQPVAPGRITKMLEAIQANGWLAGTDAFVSGYLPSAGHVAVACQAVALLRGASPAVRVVCDPVLGDDPAGLYIDREAAVAMRDRLVPLADVLTPNRFELAWLTGRPAGTLGEAAEAARVLTGQRPGRCVLVTSPPGLAEETGLLAVSAEDARLYRVRRRAAVPKGAGDVFSALIGAGLSAGAALGHLQALIDASAGEQHLAICGIGRDWLAAAPVPYKSI